MTKRIFRGKTFYTTKEEINKFKRKGDRIYYVAHKGYYLIKPKKRKSIIDIWNTIKKKFNSNKIVKIYKY